jgi:hypothetical protein
MIYETKGLTLEEVDELYSRVGKAWQSQGFVPEVRFMDVDDMNKGGRNMSLAEAAEEVQRKKSVDHVEQEKAVA